MPHPIYVVDAFTDQPFHGNPAGVCLLEQAADEAWMQRVAAEMKHAETSFLVPEGPGRWELRWFTPVAEVALCGHATLAAAHVLLAEFDQGPRLEFATRESGVLVCEATGDGRIAMDFPALPLAPSESVLIPGALELYDTGMDLLAVFPSERSVREYQPDFAAIERLSIAGGDVARGLIITAPGDREFDCVSRFFAPAFGVPEDPVTGSAHCALAPYWAARLGKSRLNAYQASARGGVILLEHLGQRVRLTGSSTLVLRGELLA